MPYVVVENPTQLPAVDFLTKSAVGPFVDTGVDAKFGERKVGHIYLSKSTIAELAELIGITNTATEQQLEAAYNRGKFDALQEGLGDDLSRVADAFTRWGAALAADPAGSSADLGAAQASA